MGEDRTLYFKERRTGFYGEPQELEERMQFPDTWKSTIEFYVKKPVTDELYKAAEEFCQSCWLEVYHVDIADDTGDNGNGYEWDHRWTDGHHPSIDSVVIEDGKPGGFGIHANDQKFINSKIKEPIDITFFAAQSLFLWDLGFRS